MTIYSIEYKDGFKTAATIHPTTSREREFTNLWQQKKFSEAMQYFPDQWKWIGLEHGNEVVGDIVSSIFPGLVLSEKAFAILNNAIPHETSFHKKIYIEGQILYWVNIIRVDFEEIHKTNHQLFSSKPLITKYVSEEVYLLCKKEGLTGKNFKLVATN